MGQCIITRRGGASIAAVTVKSTVSSETVTLRVNGQSYVAHTYDALPLSVSVTVPCTAEVLQSNGRNLTFTGDIIKVTNIYDANKYGYIVTITGAGHIEG